MTTEHMTLIEDCELREERLSDWERGFIDGLKARLTCGGSLSEKQEATLDTIWERATSKG